AEPARQLLRWLRTMRQSSASRNLRFLIAGSIGISHVLNRIGEISSINDFEHLKIEPFSSHVADNFLQALATSHRVPLDSPVRNEMLDLIGTPVPYFLQILFSEIYKQHRQAADVPTPESVRQMYHNRVLGVDCKTYFDYYYGRLRTYYDPADEKAAKIIL